MTCWQLLLLFCPYTSSYMYHRVGRLSMQWWCRHSITNVHMCIYCMYVCKEFHRQWKQSFWFVFGVLPVTTKQLEPDVEVQMYMYMYRAGLELQTWFSYNNYMYSTCTCSSAMSWPLKCNTIFCIASTLISHLSVNKSMGVTTGWICWPLSPQNC